MLQDSDVWSASTNAEVESAEKGWEVKLLNLGNALTSQAIAAKRDAEALLSATHKMRFNSEMSTASMKPYERACAEHGHDSCTFVLCRFP